MNTPNGDPIVLCRLRLAAEYYRRVAVFAKLMANMERVRRMAILRRDDRQAHERSLTQYRLRRPQPDRPARGPWRHTTPSGDRIVVRARCSSYMPDHTTRRDWYRNGSKTPFATTHVKGNAVDIEPDWTEVDAGRTPVTVVPEAAQRLQDARRAMRQRAWEAVHGPVVIPGR